jgi:anti-anti-sigma factor
MSVPLSVKTRIAGDVAILACSGRLVEGHETNELDRQMRGLMQATHSYFVVALGDVAFVDSAGLGFLVRLLSRVRGAGGDLKFCAVPPNIRKVLEVTRLHSILVPYESEAEAIAAIYQPDARSRTAPPSPVDVLCVHPSSDVLAYMHQLLHQAGYGVLTTTNLSDALTLRRATAPSVVAIDTASSATWRDGAARLIGQLPAGVGVIELSATFATDDPEAAGQRLLAEVARAAPAKL